MANAKWQMQNVPVGLGVGGNGEQPSQPVNAIGASAAAKISKEHLAFAICHLPFGIWHLAFAIDHPANL
jgi:hypothetical protein